MKLASTWPFLALAILILLISVFLLSLYYNKEGFSNPVTEKRIQYEEIGKKLYNPLADTMDWFKVNGPIPIDGTGNKLLDDVLNTPTYEAGAKSKALMDVRFDNPKKFQALPVEKFNPNVATLVNMCESVKSWDCTQFDRNDFQKYCGICRKDGVDSKGNSFDEGGLYIDPLIYDFITEEAKAKGENPQYIPTVGKCKAENFTLGRPDCDYKKHRAECAAAQSITDPKVVEKCLSCVNPPSGKSTFVFVSRLGNADTGYKLPSKPYYFNAILRIVTSYNNARLILTRDKTGAKVTSQKNGLEYSFDILGTYENESFTLSVEYPSFQPYIYTEANKRTINKNVTNDKSSLSNSQKLETAEINFCLKNNKRKYNKTNSDEYVYGCGTSKCCQKIPTDPTRRFAIVAQFESISNSLRQQAFDTAVTKINALPVNIENGPPRYGTVSSSPTFKKLVDKSNTKNLNDSRFWIWGQDNTAPKVVFSFVMPVTFRNPLFTEDMSLCPTGPLISTAEAETRLRAGACDKLINGLEQKPGAYSDACIKSLFLQTGCTAEGTGYPRTPELVKKLSYEQVPGQIVPSDFLTYFINILPVLKTKKVPEFLLNWTVDDVRNSYNFAKVKENWVREFNIRFLEPNNLTFQAPMINSTKALDKNEITEQIMARKEAADIPYIRGMNLDKYRLDNMYCYGKFEFNPCAGPNQDTGPHTLDCLDFLFKNAGKDLTSVGPTYNQSTGRSSGTDRIPEKPIQYCTRLGKMSPIDANGNINMDAVQKVNSLGDIGNIRKFYDTLHRTANYSLDKDNQYKAMNDCYGLTYAKSQPCANGQTALDNPSKLPDGTLFKLVPSLSPGSNVVNLEGALVTQSNIPVDLTGEDPLIQLFLAKVVDNSTDSIYILSRDGPPEMGYLVIDGFRVKVREYKNNYDFMQNASWNVVDSIAGNPGEVSIQSVAKPEFYMFFNQLERTINISNDKSPNSLQAFSFAIM